jgi:uncharacterized protein (UPF0333 family)
MEDLGEYLRDPFSAALIAAAITAAYVHFKAQLNNEGKLKVAQYTKPAALNAILVYFIVSQGIGQREAISTEPF